MQDKQYMEALMRGLSKSGYRMVKEKALHGQTLIIGTEGNGWKEVSAREVLKEQYHETLTVCQ